MASSRNNRKVKPYQYTPWQQTNPEYIKTSHATQDMILDARPTEDIAEWVEPPLRLPQPSWQDHKGLEGHGVLEYMQPLGAVPDAKVRKRLKILDTTRKPPPKGNFVRPRQDTSTPEPSHLFSPKRPEARQGEDKQTSMQPTRSRMEDTDYVPRTTIKIPPPRSYPATTPSTPGSAKSPKSPASFKKVVDQSIMTARDRGHRSLASALGKLYADTLYNPRTIDLLKAVLYRQDKQLTANENAAFQEYIKTAKQEAKEERRQKRSLQNDIKSSSRGERPRKKLRRSESASSLSTVRSLSSPPPDAGPSRNRIVPSSTNSFDGNITSRGPKLHVWRPGDPKGTPKQVSAKRPNGFVASSPISRPEPSAEAAELKRRSLRRHHDIDIQESDVRRSPSMPKQPGIPSISVSKVHSTRQQQTPLRNGTVRRNVHSDSDDGLSPPPEVLKPPEGIERRVTRGGTPLQPYRVAKKGARIKTSPVKKKRDDTSGPGKSGLSNGYSQPLSPGTSPDPDDPRGDNNDECEACNTGGVLICCDGCERAFHLYCLDPPKVAEEEDLTASWFCRYCRTKRNPPKPHPVSLMSKFLDNLPWTVEDQYELPEDICEHFDGINTASDGDYEDAAPPPPAPKTRAGGQKGFVEPEDHFQLVDKAGKPILCHYCGESAEGNRAIISCDFCKTPWHLDCLDPPLTHPPRQGQPDRPGYNWRCPLHVDDVDTLSKDGQWKTSVRGMPTTKLRKLRHPKPMNVQDVSMRMGHKNNGNVMIINDSDAEDESDREDQDNTVYRLHSVNIKREFLLAADRRREEASEREGRDYFIGKVVEAIGRAREHETVKDFMAQLEIFKARPESDQAAAKSLVSMAADMDLFSRDKLPGLIFSLFNQAPESTDRSDDHVTQDQRHDEEVGSVSALSDQQGFATQHFPPASPPTSPIPSDDYNIFGAPDRMPEVIIHWRDHQLTALQKAKPTTKLIISARLFQSLHLAIIKRFGKSYYSKLEDYVNLHKSSSYYHLPEKIPIDIADSEFQIWGFVDEYTERLDEECAWPEDDFIHESSEEIWEEMMQDLWKDELSEEEHGGAAAGNVQAKSTNDATTVTTPKAVIPAATAGPSNANNPPTPPSPSPPSSSSWPRTLADKLIEQVAKEIGPPLPQITTSTAADEKRSLMLLMDLCKRRMGQLEDLDLGSTGGDDDSKGGGDDKSVAAVEEEEEELLATRATRKAKGKGKGKEPAKKKDKGKGKGRAHP